MQVYVAPEVLAVEALHPYLRDEAFRASSIHKQLAEQAAVLHAAHTAGDDRIRMQVMSWWPQAKGRTLEDILSSAFTMEDARLTLAREYGYDDWTGVNELHDAVADIGFEQALDDLIAGNADALAARLQSEPRLATQTSAYGHRATLLHYIGANGVESHRQRTPMNAVELAELLIGKGADRGARANMYGGGQTPFALASTSAHPRKAGISEALNRVLAKGLPHG